jgi:hypothetical protein
MQYLIKLIRLMFSKNWETCAKLELSSQVAAQLLTPKEKDEVAQLVDTMLGFGISYRHPKPGMYQANYGIERESALALDPPIDTLVKFKVIPFSPVLCWYVSFLCHLSFWNV